MMKSKGVTIKKVTVVWCRKSLWQPSIRDLLFEVNMLVCRIYSTLLSYRGLPQVHGLRKLLQSEYIEKFDCYFDNNRWYPMTAKYMYVSSYVLYLANNTDLCTLIISLLLFPVCELLRFPMYMCWRIEFLINEMLLSNSFALITKFWLKILFLNCCVDMNTE